MKPKFGPVPEEIKSSQHFMKLAEEYDRSNIVLAYYLRMAVIHRAMSIVPGQKPPEVESFLSRIMDWLEATKAKYLAVEGMEDEGVAMSIIEEKINKMYNYAYESDFCSVYNKHMVKAYWTVVILCDVMAQFGPWSNKIREKWETARARAIYIHNLCKKGMTPTSINERYIANEELEKRFSKLVVSGKRTSQMHQVQAEQNSTTPSYKEKTNVNSGLSYDATKSALCPESTKDNIKSLPTRNNTSLKENANHYQKYNCGTCNGGSYRNNSSQNMTSYRVTTYDNGSFVPRRNKSEKAVTEPHKEIMHNNNEKKAYTEPKYTEGNDEHEFRRDVPHQNMHPSPYTYDMAQSSPHNVVPLRRPNGLPHKDNVYGRENARPNTLNTALCDGCPTYRVDPNTESPTGDVGNFCRNMSNMFTKLKPEQTEALTARYCKLALHAIEGEDMNKAKENLEKALYLCKIGIGR